MKSIERGHCWMQSMYRSALDQNIPYILRKFIFAYEVTFMIRYYVKHPTWIYSLCDTPADIWYQLMCYTSLHENDNKIEQNSSLVSSETKHDLEVWLPGGTQIIFWGGVRSEVWNPYPYLRIFLPPKNKKKKKTADLMVFQNFRKIGTHF